MPTRKTLSLLIISLLVLACDSEKVLYEIKLPKPKISEASFGKDSSFLKWNIKKIPQEKIFRYAFSYGIVGGATLESKKIVHTNTLGKGFRITGLKEGENHWIKVQAVYAEFLGPWSDAVEGITGKPEPPLDFTVEKKTEDAKWYVDVSWNDHPANEEEKLEIKKYHVKCWDENDPTKKYEIPEDLGKVYSFSTKGKLETTRKAKYVCSVQTETDKGTKSEVKQSTGIEFHDIESPSLSSASVAWGTVITFAKSTDHSYKLKESKDGVRLDTSKTLAEITATKPVADVVVVATRAGYTGTAESKTITFTKQEGDTFSFSQASYSQQFNTNENKFQQALTMKDDLADTRDLKYRIAPSGSGASINADSGEVSITLAAVGQRFTVTASKAVSEKYKAQSADYQLEIKASTGSSGVTRPALNSASVAWGTAITFEKEAGHSYKLKESKDGVNLDISVTPAEITATKPVADVVVVAIHVGWADSIDSAAITFTKQAGTTLLFAQTTQTKTTGEGSFTSSTKKYEFTLQSLNQGAGADSRTITYSTTKGTIDTAQTKLTIRARAIADLHKTGESITIAVRKAMNEKYLEQTASYTLTITPQWTALEKPRLSASGTVMWDEKITFAHVADHSYSLKDDKGGTVNLSKNRNTWTVSATKLASGVVVVATHEYTGESEKSDAINFTKHSLRGKVLNIPPGTTSIGKDAFKSKGLTSVVIPDSVTSIGDAAFRDNELTSVTIPNSVKSINPWAFGENKLKTVTIGNSVTSIGNFAFENNKLKTVTIPDSVKSIGRSAFQKNALKSVTIGNSVTSIGEAAFFVNKLTSVIIPKSVINIGLTTFWTNRRLTSVKLSKTLHKKYGKKKFRDMFEKRRVTYTYH